MTLKISWVKRDFFKKELVLGEYPGKEKAGILLTKILQLDQIFKHVKTHLHKIQKKRSIKAFIKQIFSSEVIIEWQC